MPTSYPVVKHKPKYLTHAHNLRSTLEKHTSQKKLKRYGVGHGERNVIGDGV